MKAPKYNSIKTLKLINKTPILTDMFIKIEDDFKYDELKDTAINDELSLSEITALKTIFNSIILKNEVYVKQYTKISIKDKTPRRYGKVQIEKDIKAQKGIITDLQKTMFALSQLNSMVINLVYKGTCDRYKDTDKLHGDKGKRIREAIRTFRKETEHILNSK